MIEDHRRLVKASKIIAKKAGGKVKQTSGKVALEIRRKTGGAIVAAFAFIIALVWRDVIVEIVNQIVTTTGIEDTTYVYQLLLAIITTVIAVIGILYFSKWSEEKK